MLYRAFMALRSWEPLVGVLLLLSAIAGLLAANSGLSALYNDTLTRPLLINLPFDLGGRSLHFWVNDCLMAVFFFVVGCEIKHELLRGELSHWKHALLPLICALGGMGLPALIYLVVNLHTPEALRGWAIPSATDIAFSLGALSVFSKRVPSSLKAFLGALAILDDLGAIVIIAFVFSAKVHGTALVAALLLLLAALVLNRIRYYGLVIILIAPCLWYAVLQSGIHATLTGVLLAITIPLERPHGASPLLSLTRGVTPIVSFFILPLFAFLNAGVSLNGVALGTVLAPVSLGILLGLFVGKQLGVFLCALLSSKLRLTHLPRGASLMQLYGVSVLTGIGFTMSLFISALAFPSAHYVAETRLGILLGSLLSTILGMVLLSRAAYVKEDKSSSVVTKG